MDLKIVEKKEQPLLSRTLIRGIAGFEASTPSRAELRKKVSQEMKVGEDKVAVSSIRTIFGAKKAEFELHIYGSAGDMAKFESGVVLTRLGLRERKAKAEAKPAK